MPTGSAWKPPALPGGQGARGSWGNSFTLWASLAPEEKLAPGTPTHRGHGADPVVNTRDEPRAVSCPVTSRPVAPVWSLKDPSETPAPPHRPLHDIMELGKRLKRPLWRVDTPQRKPRWPRHSSILPPVWGAYHQGGSVEPGQGQALALEAPPPTTPPDTAESGLTLGGGRSCHPPSCPGRVREAGPVLDPRSVICEPFQRGVRGALSG